MATGFVYCWTDIKTNKLYVGVHKGAADDGYVCSSKYMMEEYNNRTQDFSRQIIAEGEYTMMRKLEEKILKSINAKSDPMFYNQHNGDGNFYLKGHTEEARKAIGKAHKGRVRKDLSERNKKGPTPEQISKQVRTKKSRGYYLSENNPMYGKKHSLENKQKHSERMKGENNPNFGKQFSPETKNKMSEARKLYWLRKKNNNGN